MASRGKRKRKNRPRNRTRGAVKFVKLNRVEVKAINHLHELLVKSQPSLQPSRMLDDAKLVQIAHLSVAGSGPEEIAVKLGYSRRRLLAQFRKIRKQWAQIFFLRKKIEESDLNYREREILKLRCGLADGYSYTLEEVGKIFSFSRERVRQIEVKAVRKLQDPQRARSFSRFIDGVPV